jgi:hypothetical protein
MAVYIYTPDSNKYDSLLLANSRSYDTFKRLTGDKRGTAWEPLPVRAIKGRKSGDFPSISSRHVRVCIGKYGTTNSARDRGSSTNILDPK